MCCVYGESGSSLIYRVYGLYDNTLLSCLLQIYTDHYFAVPKEVFDVAPKWRGFGVALRLSPISLKNIEIRHRFGSEECLRNTLSEYLMKNYKYEKHGNLSWKKIVEAISDRAGGNNNAQALRIAEYHSMAIQLL